MQTIEQLAKNNVDIDTVRKINGVPEVVFVCWFGTTISNVRLRALNSLLTNLKVPYILITDENLELYAKNLHFTWDSLAVNHKSDYLRAYLMHNYGGGYHDVKFRHDDWIGQWSAFEDDNVWIKSRREKYPHWIGYDIDHSETKWIQQRFHELGTMGWCICRPKTDYTANLLAKIEHKLNLHSEKLKSHPAKNQTTYYSNNPFKKVTGNYPLRWLELMGEHFHLLMYKFRDHMVFGLPDAGLETYK